jgi:RNA polymerase sigma-19 factor, ECF subfamily
MSGGDKSCRARRSTGKGLSQLRQNDADRLVEGLAHDFGLDLIRFIAKRVRTLADARDLAQEAYVRLLRMERKDLIRNPRAYLYRIAANILYEFELKRKADVAGLSRWSDEQHGDSDSGYGENEVEDLALRSRLDRVLSELSPKCRAVLILHRRDGMTYDEIGAEIGISSSMVKKYLSQGLRHCRERLAESR